MHISIALSGLAALAISAYCGHHAMGDLKSRRWALTGVGTISCAAMLAAGLWLLYASIAAFGV